MVFNRVGYDGTDSNQFARAAGHAPATFYKHFPDKRAIFLAAYERWVSAEWAEVERILDGTRGSREEAAKIVDLTLMHHRRRRGLRASLRALVCKGASPYRAQRRRQLRMMARLRAQRGAPDQVERDAVQLLRWNALAMRLPKLKRQHSASRPSVSSACCAIWSSLRWKPGAVARRAAQK